MIQLPAWFAHDLAQPINALNLSLQEQGTGLAQASPLLLQSAGELGTMLRSLREYIRLESNQAPPVRQAVDLGEMLQRVVDARPLAEPDKTLSLRGIGNLAVDSSLSLLHTLTNNIFLNAWQHAQTTVSLSATVQDRQVRLEIADDGPGISEELIARLGMPFIRDQSPLAGPRRGFGLGLYVAARIAEQLGHRLELRSSSSGTTVTLSMAAATTAPAALPSSTGVANPLQQKRILIVDADDHFSNTVSALLQSWGCQTTQRKDWQETATPGADKAALLIVDSQLWQAGINQGLPNDCPPAVLIVTRDEAGSPPLGPHFDEASQRFQAGIQRPFSPLRLRRALLALLAACRESAD